METSELWRWMPIRHDWPMDSSYPGTLTAKADAEDFPRNWFVWLGHPPDEEPTGIMKTEDIVFGMIVPSPVPGYDDVNEDFLWRLYVPTQHGAI